MSSPKIEIVERKGIKTLVIECPIETEPKPSSSGKTLVVASSRGNIQTTATVNGHAVKVGFNAYIPL